MVEEFGENVLSGSGKWIKAQVSFAADVINNVCVDAVIGPYLQSEGEQAKEHLNKLGTNNLYLFDRGYFGRAFLNEVFKTGCQFCFRVQKNACREIVSFINSDQTDQILNIDVDDEKIKVRATKIVLDTGEEEYLVSTLFDKKVFTRHKLKSLYHLRWGVEEQFKDMKYAICVENFIGKKPNSIRQEFYANILSYNVSMMSCKPLIDRISNKKKHKYKTNKRALLAKFKQCFVNVFYIAEKIGEILNDIVETVSKESVPIRKGRKFSRGKTTKAKRKFHRAYNSVS